MTAHMLTLPRNNNPFNGYESYKMKDWRSVAIFPDVTFEKAIKVLDEGGLRIVVVIDEGSRLLGTVTDGDIRRALLRHVPLDAKVQNIMCSTPIVASPNLSQDELLSKIEHHKILHLPIVSEDGVLLGLHTLHELIGSKRLENPVFLMAGGFGKRLFPLTESCPKPMLKVGDKPMLEIIIHSFMHFGFYKFFISTHYLPEVIRDYFGNGEKWGIEITYIHEDVPLGTGGALGLLPHDDINMPIFLMNGDILTKIDFRSLLEFHCLHGGSATVCVREYESTVPYGVIQSDGHRIKSIVEKPTYKHFISAGVYVLSPEVVRAVANGSVIDMPSLLENEINAGNVVNMFPVHEYWLDIGRIDDFERAQRDIKDIQ